MKLTNLSDENTELIQEGKAGICNTEFTNIFVEFVSSLHWVFVVQLVSIFFEKPTSESLINVITSRKKNSILDVFVQS